MKNKMIFGLHACTSIHAGAGSSLGVIDLPIQREGHNGWPCVFGSAMKGALRAHAENFWHDNLGMVLSMFGPDTNNASEYAGAIMVSDARLLLLPVRSLTSQFKWVTCPQALVRFKVDCKRFGCLEPELPESLNELTNDCALVPDEASPGNLYLEEYRFETKSQDFAKIIEHIAPLMSDANYAEAVLGQQLVIISDDMFSHLCTHATPVSPHIAIDTETGTVKGGALWYEETLPPETLLYSGIHTTKSRMPRTKGEPPSAKETPVVIADSASMADKFRDLFHDDPWLQIGGNETVGMGWVNINEYGV